MTKEEKNKKKKKNFFLTVLKAFGVCAGAYFILSLLSQIGEKEEPKNKIHIGPLFKERNTEKIIEAKIESWR